MKCVLLVMGAAIAACASYPLPIEHLATATAAVRVAQEVGASKTPQAELEVTIAAEEVEKARALLEKGKNERADYMTLRAYNDADLALALTREYEATLRAQQAAARERDADPSRK